MSEEIIYLDTFAGAGGFALAIQEVEPTAKCIGFSELDYEIKNGKKSKVFSKVAYKHHFPTHPDLGDINGIDIGALPYFNLLVGGSPCQDLSIAKKGREGLKGTRSGLFFKYLEILKTKKPKWFILENVASMPKESKEEITRLLKEIYPEVYCTMLDASLVSAQSRKRLFWTNFPVTQPEDRKIFLKDILEPVVDEKYFITNPAVLEKLKFLKGKKDVIREKNGFQYHFREGEMPLTQDGQAKALPVLASQQAVGRTTNYVADSQGQRVYGTDAKGDTLCGNGGGLGAKTGLYIMPDKAYPIDANYQKGIDVEGYLQRQKRQIVSGVALRTREEGKEAEEREDGKANCLTSVNTDSMVKASTITECCSRAASSTAFIREADRVASSGFGIRRLTPIECARLQSFPDDWLSVAGLSDSAQYKAYGNAVNVEVVKHIVRQIPR